MGTFPTKVSATELTDAVDAYNTSASELQSLYDAFVDAQDVAYTDFQVMYNNLGYFIMEDNLDEALAYWDAHETAKGELQASCISLDEAFFEGFLLELDETANLLQLVITLDEASSSEVAYVDGPSHFLLPASPFLFWKDEGEPPYEEFVEFEFPLLSVGDPGSHSSYSSETLGGLIDLIGDLWEWIRAGLWFNKHKDTGRRLNEKRANDWDALCEWCLCVLENENLEPPEGYTREEAEEFCDTYSDEGGWEGNGLCADSNMSISEKSFWIRRLFPSKMLDDLRKVDETVKDYIQTVWYWDFPWSGILG